MPSIPPEHNDELFSRRSIKNALKLLRKPSQNLGKHPLAIRLECIELKRQEKGYGKNLSGYGHALQDVLEEAIEGLKPNEEKPNGVPPKNWRPHEIITKQYLVGNSRKYICKELAISDGVYGREQNEGIDHIADWLRKTCKIIPVETEPVILENKTKKRIFISYQRGTEPDQDIAIRIAQSLNELHTVFFDQCKKNDSSWAKNMQEELKKADGVVFLLSNKGIHDEVVLHQLKVAQERKVQRGQPRLLPVWLRTSEDSLHSKLSESEFSLLTSLRWSCWQNQDETSNLISELKKAIAGHQLPLAFSEITKQDQKSSIIRPSSSSSYLRVPSGALPLDFPFYIERQADKVAHETIKQKMVTVVIKGPRQIGKTSFIQRLGQTARQEGKRFIYLDCNLLKVSQSDAESFFKNFGEVLTDGMGLKDRITNWERPLINAARCTTYIDQEILPHLKQPWVIALDNADSLFDTTYKTNFFAMLRTWHNKRANNVEWRRIDLVLAVSTEAYFIKNLTQSPFNVGKVIILKNLTQKQVTELNHHYGFPLSSEEERELMTLVNGHPYLVQKALFLVATKQYSSDQLFSRATDDRGPFHDHLWALFLRLHYHDDLRKSFIQVLRKNICPDEVHFWRLQGAGLVHREQGIVTPSCKLYSDFFKERFNE